MDVVVAGTDFVCAGESLSNSDRLADCLGFVVHGREEFPPPDRAAAAAAGGREV